MRLIDADALKEKFKERSYWTYTHEYGDAIPIGWIMSGIDNAPTVERPIRCKDCKHQTKDWHEDKRMKEGGYWVYDCDFISDPFESTPVCGQPEEYCSSAEKKGGAE